MNSKTLYNLLYECASEKEIDNSVFNDIFTNSLVTVLKNKYGEDITREGTCHYDYQKLLGLISDVVISNYAYMYIVVND